MSIFDQAKTHSKHGYKIITGSLALNMTKAQLAPAQRGFVNRHRRLSGVDPFPRPDIKAGGVMLEVKNDLARSVARAREEQREEPEAVQEALAAADPAADAPPSKSKKPAKAKKPRKGIFGRTA